MKIFAMILLLTWSVFTISCKKETQIQPQPIQNDSVMTTDSMASGMSPVYPDSINDTATIDSTSYRRDSIMNRR